MYTRFVRMYYRYTCRQRPVRIDSKHSVHTIVQQARRRACTRDSRQIDETQSRSRQFSHYEAPRLEATYSLEPSGFEHNEQHDAAVLLMRTDFFDIFRRDSDRRVLS